MKPQLILLAIGATALVSLLMVSCHRPPLEELPEVAPLGVKLDVVDGIRTVDRLLRRPELVITVVNGSDDASYEAVFSINDGPERRVRSVWNGVPKDLSGELLAQSEYGPITLKGYLYDTGAISDRVPLDTTLWIAYAPATRGSILIRTGEREEILVSGSVFMAGEDGTLEIGYTPVDTFLHIEVTVPEGSPIVFSEAVNREGHFRIPFSVHAEGESVITLLTSNGRDESSNEYSIICRPAQTGDSN